MRSFKFFALTLLLMLTSPLFAHVGSPGVLFQGKAGPYTILVNVNPPDVIPGTASTSIFVEEGQVNHIYIQAVYWTAGESGTPRSDEAFQNNGRGAYLCQLWLMQSGVSNIKITVEGPLGKGVAIVPVMAVSTAQRGMDLSFFLMLLALFLFLGVLMLTIVRACISDGISAPGEKPKTTSRKKNSTVIITAAVLLLSVAGGVHWWNQVRIIYKHYLYQSPKAHSSVVFDGNQKYLHLSIDTAWLHKNNKTMDYVVPDHGKMMHLFLVRDKSIDVFAHLHPTRLDSVSYVSPLPADLPAGRYLVFGDIVKWNGYSETIRDTVDIPEKPSVESLSLLRTKVYHDPDDVSLTSTAINNKIPAYTGKFTVICGSPGSQIKLQDGSTAAWHHPANETFLANAVYPLTFLIAAPDGKPAKLEPYMGMAGHAAILKYDGSVYVHLHPVGNFSMESQALIQKRLKDTKIIPALPEAHRFMDSVDKLVGRVRAMTEDERNQYLKADMKTMSMPDMKMESNDGLVTFPYAFPSAGNYRVWVQVKRNGQILSAVFDCVVQQ